MVVNKKTKVRAGVVIIALSIFLILISQNQTVNVLYFINPNCELINQTDSLMEDLKKDFGDRINIQEINVKMYDNDLPDTEYIKQLREKYHVYGVPEIVINGKEFTGQFTKDNLKKQICYNFLIKPEVCK